MRKGKGSTEADEDENVNVKRPLSIAQQPQVALGYSLFVIDSIINV